jgi:hypothetical protein
MLDRTDIPKRGDLLHTNGGSRRERTCLILKVLPLKPTAGVPRCRVWAERWWEIDYDLRLRLFLSAERNGGQRVIHFKRYNPKKKIFEQHMRRKHALDLY